MTLHAKTRYDERLEEIARFEAENQYDATYMKELLRDAPDAYEVFAGFLPMAGHRASCPADLYHVASIAAYRQVDCGPCLQLAIRRARADGVAPELIKATLSAATDGLSPDQARVRAFARGLLVGDPEIDALRQQLVASHGPVAVAEIALRVAAAHVFPVVKRALGHYRSCSLAPLEIA